MRNYYPLSIEAMIKTKDRHIKNLICQYKLNPLKTHYGLKRKFVGDNYVYDYCLMVLFSDKYLTPTDETPENVKKYYYITGSLPMELQMVISYRRYMLPNDVIVDKDINGKFKKLLN